MTRRAPLLVATDASLTDRSGTFAMVDAAGRFAVASVFPHTRMSQVAEATGILAALHTAPAGRPIHILSDSLNTIALVRTAVRVGFPAGVDARFDMASAIVETSTARPTTTVIHWVKAHTSNTGAALLHGSADRLARAAARNNTFELQPRIAGAHLSAACDAIAAAPVTERSCPCGWDIPTPPAGHKPDDLTVTIRPTTSSPRA